MGVPGGTKGSLMSIDVEVENVALPEAPALDFGDGAPLESVPHGTGLAEIWLPPALTRSTTTPAAPTVSVAALVVALPFGFVNTARYCLPLSVGWATKL